MGNYAGWSVKSTTGSSTAGTSVTFEKDNPTPPPEKLTKTLTPVDDYYDDLVSACCGDKTVDFTTDPADTNMTSLTIHG